ncbi:50S ribosomal protein L30 [Oenococcus sp. UCMA 16435]|nr:50S ribosomal protein L30 [Oenococcus sp. UCMA 16435]MDI4585055.1 50S ribosomal protein L30 [Oenococcus sp. UCMA 14587]
MADLKITLIKSIVHREPRQREIAKSLGLGRVHSSVVRPDNAATRGVIFKIAHLISVEEVKK